jgi:hypothetical protein
VTQLLVIPINLVGAIAEISSAFTADRLQRRFPLIFAGCLLGSVSFFVLGLVQNNWGECAEKRIIFAFLLTITYCHFKCDMHYCTLESVVFSWQVKYSQARTGAANFNMLVLTIKYLYSSLYHDLGV